MNQKNKAVIAIIILSLVIGSAITMIVENIRYNKKLTQRINTIADSDKPLFRIGDDVFRIERVNTSIFEVTDNVFINGTP